MKYYFVSFWGMNDKGTAYGNISFKCTKYLHIREAEENILKKNNFTYVVMNGFQEVSKEIYDSMQYPKKEIGER